MRQRPYWKVCRDACAQIDRPPHRNEDGYSNCGREEQNSKAVRKDMIKELKERRRQEEVTSGPLQRWLACKKHIEVEESTTRKHLKKEGYWRRANG